MTIEEKREAANMILSADVKTLLSPEMSNTLDRFDSSMNNVKDTANTINDTLQTANEVINNVSMIWNCTLDTVKAVKELDVILKQMDVSLEMFLKNSDVNLAKFQTNAGIVEKQLDRISDRIDKVLDNALSIDSKNCAIVDLELKSKLISQVRDWSDHISSLLMRLMGA